MKTQNLILLIIVLFTFNLQAQNSKTFDFDGRVLIDNKKAADVFVRVYEKNKLVHKHITSKNGRFIFEAKREKYYTLEFSKKGYLNKKVVVSTKNTNTVDGPVMTYRFDIVMDPIASTINHDPDFPVAVIELKKGEDEFMHSRILAQK